MALVRPLSALGLLVSTVVMAGCADRNVTPLADASTSSSTDSGEASSSSTSTTDNGTTDTSTTDTSTTDTDDGTSFVPITEFANDSCQCDPFAQDCANGEKCVPYSAEAEPWSCVKCVDVLGDRAAGEPCTYDGLLPSTDDCDDESFCFTSGTEGICRAFCSGTADDPVCDAGTACVITNFGNITLCLPDCDPLIQDCDPGTGCYWADTAFACLTLGDFGPGDIPTGELCGNEGLTDCAPGNVCIKGLEPCAGLDCCAAYCDLDNPACPMMWSECVAFFEIDMAPSGQEHVGVCMNPP